ncbi:hypothetical protein AAVH_28907 [Aphelenchoides avenae]|nr:hypothetical protein AAVH_28907 [Aphelenchus avenae]
MKEEPSEVTEEMDALYEDVMENGVEMETIEVDDSLPSTEPSCSSRPPGATTTPIRENTKLMTINIRRSLNGVVVAPTYSARSLWPQTTTSRTPSSGTAKRFTVIVPRRTPHHKHFQQRQAEYAASTGSLMQANIGTRSAPIVLDGEEPSIEGEEEPEVMHDELSIPGTNDDAKATSAYVADARAEAMPSLPAESGFSPAASGSNEAPIEADIYKPMHEAAEVPQVSVQLPTKDPDAKMLPGPSNSVSVVDPMRPLEAALTARKTQKTLRSSTDRLRQQWLLIDTDDGVMNNARGRSENSSKRERRNAELKATMALIESQIKMLNESLTAE